MKCLETRRRADGLRWRRYRDDDDGSIVHTVEVPAPVWRAINSVGRGANRLAQWQRGTDRKAKRAEVLRLAAAGWRLIAVESQTGVPLRTVQRWVAAGGPKTSKGAKHG
jgi:hypothetical protein